MTVQAPFSPALPEREDANDGCDDAKDDGCGCLRGVRC